MAYLIKSTNTYRVATVGEALKLREELENMPGELTAFKYTHKDIKSKGEIIESYEVVTATLAFQSEKEPETSIREHYGEDD